MLNRMSAWMHGLPWYGHLLMLPLYGILRFGATLLGLLAEGIAGLLRSAGGGIAASLRSFLTKFGVLLVLGVGGWFLMGTLSTPQQTELLSRIFTFVALAAVLMFLVRKIFRRH